VRLDPLRGSVVSRIAIESGVPTFLRATARQVFVSLADPVSSDGTLLIIDPATNRVTTTLHLGRPIGPVLADADGAWLPVRASSGDAWELQRLDPITGALDAIGSLPAVTDVNGLAIADDGVGWAITTRRSVFSFDPATARVVGSAVTIASSPTDLLSLVATRSGIWALSTEAAIRIEP
jgi:hypothetical protein